MSEKLLTFEIRTRLAMNLGEFSIAHGVSRSTVSEWVNGHRVIQSGHVKMLKALGISQQAIEYPNANRIDSNQRQEK